jgi:hypothetical protein
LSNCKASRMASQPAFYKKCNFARGGEGETLTSSGTYRPRSHVVTEFMNIGHTIALALVGWYLMVPPDLAQTSWDCTLSRGSQFWIDQCVDVPDPTAPLSKWHDVAHPIVNSPECEVAANHQAIGTTIRDMGYHSRCIASDDPRLAR